MSVRNRWKASYALLISGKRKGNNNADTYVDDICDQ